MRVPPKISVITPTYNHEKYIEMCITSVINQSYKNWEMIIIDDCSSDSTRQIIDRYAKKDTRIKVIYNKKNLGIYKLDEIYNNALSLASGELITILEGDDYWPENKLKVQIKSFKNTHIVLSYGDCIIVDTDNTPLFIKYYWQNTNLLNNDPPGIILSAMMKLDLLIIPSTIMIKKSALVLAGGFTKSRNYPYIDIPTILELTKQGKFNYVKKVMGYYRKHIDSSWFTYIMNDKYLMRRNIQLCLLCFIKQNKKSYNLLVKEEETILKYQNKVLEKYRKYRKFYIFIRLIIFSDFKNSAKFILNLEKKTYRNFVFYILLSLAYFGKPILLKFYYLFSISFYTLLRLYMK